MTGVNDIGVGAVFRSPEHVRNGAAAAPAADDDDADDDYDAVVDDVVED